MSTPERFEISVDGSRVTARIDRPEVDAGAAVPTVLICSMLPLETHAEAAEDLAGQITTALADAGLAVVSFRPRLTSLADNGRAARPQQIIDDASAVFRELLRRSDVDRDRVGVLGYSSGAIVASCLAGRASRFLAGLCLVAPTDVDTLLQGTAADEEAASPPEPFVEALRELDPIADASSHERSTLIVHGAADRDVDPEVAMAYHRRMLNAGHQTRLVLIPRGDHGFSNVETRVAFLQQMVDFFAAMASRAAGTAGT